VPGAAGYARLYGTSFAVPQVSATLAMMLGLNPNLSHAQLLEGLRLSARPHVVSPQLAACSSTNPGRCACSTATCGVGILDAEQAQNYALRPLSYVSPVRAAAVIDNADLNTALALAPQDIDATVPPVMVADSGGGAFSGLWVIGVAAAVLALWRERRRSGQAGREALRRQPLV
jgi:serine protease